MHLEVKRDPPAVLRPLIAFPSREDDEFSSLQPISLRGELRFVPANPFIVIFQPGYHIRSHLATSLLPQRGRRSKFHFQLTGNFSSAVPGVGQLWKKGPTFSFHLSGTQGFQLPPPGSPLCRKRSLVPLQGGLLSLDWPSGVILAS